MDFIPNFKIEILLFFLVFVNFKMEPDGRNIVKDFSSERTPQIHSQQYSGIPLGKVAKSIVTFQISNWEFCIFFSIFSVYYCSQWRIINMSF